MHTACSFACIISPPERVESRVAVRMCTAACSVPLVCVQSAHAAMPGHARECTKLSHLEAEAILRLAQARSQ
eukprot:542209-Alexandrium_andersonii.AAC.1